MSQGQYDVVVIGAGQSGLAVGRLLSRSELTYIMLDAEDEAGGSWQYAWDSLRLFSPALWSSLPGRIMPGGTDYYPTRDETLTYLREYEEWYKLKVERPVLVSAVRRAGAFLEVESDAGSWLARAVISATGSERNPYIPDYPGRELFRGTQIHSRCYRSPERFSGQRVLIVGGANSGAQILAELSLVADTTWVTRREPTFLPDDVDGRALFDRATHRYRARESGEPVGDSEFGRDLFGDIVMLPSVLAARERGDLVSVRPFERFTETGVVWPGGRETPVDAMIWCTGFRLDLDHLQPLGVIGADGQVATAGARSIREPRVWLVGYGEWTGYASATLIGVGRSARATVEEIVEVLESSASHRGA